MMEDCKNIQNILPLYVDNDVLTAAEIQQVEDHVAHCSACQQELTDLRENVSLLQAMGRSIFQAPTSLSGNVMSALREEGKSFSSVADSFMGSETNQPSVFRKRRFIPGIAAAVVLLATVVGTSQLLPDSSQAPVQVAQEIGETIPSSPVLPDTGEKNTEKELTSVSSPADIADSTEAQSAATVEKQPEAEAVQPVEPTIDEGNTAAETVPQNVPAESQSAAEPGTEPETEEPAQLPAESVPSSGNVVLLNQNNQTRSTLLKMSFTDQKDAVQMIESTVASFGGNVTDKTISTDSNCEIITVKVPQTQADSFIVSITDAGLVLSQEQNLKTSLYGQLMEEYLQLQAQLSSSNSQEVSMQLKTQLSEVEQQMNSAQQEAQYESVVIWVQLSE